MYWPIALGLLALGAVASALRVPQAMPAVFVLVIQFVGLNVSDMFGGWNVSINLLVELIALFIMYVVWRVRRVGLSQIMVALIVARVFVHAGTALYEDFEYRYLLNLLFGMECAVIIGWAGGVLRSSHNLKAK